MHVPSLGWLPFSLLVSRGCGVWSTAGTLGDMLAVKEVWLEEPEATVSKPSAALAPRAQVHACPSASLTAAFPLACPPLEASNLHLASSAHGILAQQLCSLRAVSRELRSEELVRAHAHVASAVVGSLSPGAVAEEPLVTTRALPLSFSHGTPSPSKRLRGSGIATSRASVARELRGEQTPGKLPSMRC
jgi:hypothetical protein